MDCVGEKQVLTAEPVTKNMAQKPGKRHSSEALAGGQAQSEAEE